MKKGDKVLVTGGTGYIGSHTVVELQQKGFDVIIADNFSNSSESVIDSIEKITGKRPVFEFTELCEREQTQSLFKKHKDLKAVIHFAAFKAVGESVENPLLYYKNNIFSLVNVLEAMKEIEIPNLVFSSSCTVYGQPDKLPVDENTPLQKSSSPYGETKQMSEKIISDTVKATFLNSISLRYFNPTGAHDSAMIGELPIEKPNNLVPFITQTAVGKRDELQVFGGDYNTPDGTCIRDYIHVVDLAKAHLIALERLMDNKNKSKNEIFNLGTGIGYSVLDTIHSFERVSGEKLNYKIVQRRPGDVEKIYADTTYANKELNWKAERDLDNMMLTAWKWELALNQKTNTPA
ncbi:MAG: UDP-glucose 4-epimerase GalE [Bacteroidetes bacterium]|nr:UDP-glucose 4-epimerase GalE [Bacteroidota bacterium]HET6245702.1 UDP-glucose 4-epimerase GalE [Bacteroidia bacterium]